MEMNNHKDLSTHASHRLTAAQRGYGYRWQKYATGFLKRNPVCVIHEKAGQLVASECVDHIVAHKLDPQLFWDPENHQALCIACNSRKGAKVEGRWAPKSYTMPEGLRPSVIPLVIVCGPPAGGKDTYVRNNMGANDLVINTDDICMEMVGKRLVAAGKRWVKNVFERRNVMLMALGDEDMIGEYDRAWLVVCAPTMKVREFLNKHLQPEAVVMMMTSHAECLRRVKADDCRAGHVGDNAVGVTRWYDQFDGVTMNDCVVEG